MADMLYDQLFRHAMRIPPAFDYWEQHFRGLPVYDLTSTVGLAVEGLKFGVPKRPPHERMWAEWTEEGGCGRRGVLIEPADRGQPTDDNAYYFLTCYALVRWGGETRMELGYMPGFLLVTNHLSQSFFLISN